MQKEFCVFRFKPYISKSKIPVKSLTMEEGDIDSDGDKDIILRLFSHSPIPVPAELKEKWDSARYGLNIFFNQLHHQ